jgi:hypothetical protein
MSYKCKECGEEFTSEKALHAHIKKHGLYVADYYVKHYPRFNKLNGNPIQFKNKEQYFSTDFANRNQMRKWCEESDKNEVRQYILNCLAKRVQSKEWEYAPNHLELYKTKLPDINIYKKYYGGYNKACKELGLEPLLKMPLTQKFFNDFDVKVLIDTREQKPLHFKKSESLKLAFGDYTLSGGDFTNTFVDRKSPTDFIGTFGKGFDRFRREMERCVEVDAYMYVVIEKEIRDLHKFYFPGKRPSTLNWALSNMVKLQHEFPRRCQFIFTRCRAQSEMLIPKLLALGEELWETDIQYYIEKENVLGSR